MTCNCKYCSDSKRIQTTREIGENYNYSCKEHKKRADLKWVLVSYVIEQLKLMNGWTRYYKDKHIQKLIKKLEEEGN